MEKYKQYKKAFPNKNDAQIIEALGWELSDKVETIGRLLKLTKKPIGINNEFLTDKEKQSIKVLNFIAEFDGIIRSEDDIKYLLQQGIEKFIAKKRRHLVSITETAYPVRIKY